MRAPTLVITGSQDMLTPFGDAEELAEMIPGARLRELRGAAHGLMVEQPGAFNAAVLEFLRDVDTRLAGRPAAPTVDTASPSRRMTRRRPDRRRAMRRTTSRVRRSVRRRDALDDTWSHR